MDWIHVNHLRSLVVRPVVPVVLRTYFDVPWKIEDLTKSKNFCGKLLQKIKKLHHFSEKNIFGVRCTFKSLLLKA